MQTKSFIMDRWFDIIILAIAIPLLTNGLSMFLENKPVIIIAAAVGIIMLVWIVVRAVSVIQAKRKTIGEGEAFKLKRKGLIFTISFKSHESDSPLLKVLEKFQPEYCGFIGTKETMEKGVVRSIINNSSIKSDNYYEKVVIPTNVKEIKEDTDHLIQWMLDKGLSAHDIVVDITGGTAIMSVAAWGGENPKILTNKSNTPFVPLLFRLMF